MLNYNTLTNKPIKALPNEFIENLIEELTVELQVRNSQSTISAHGLKLPHFIETKYLSPLQLRVVKTAWGNDGYPPPIWSWRELRQRCFTSVHSLPTVFGKKNEWKEFFTRVSHGKYQLRRVAVNVDIH